MKSNLVEGKVRLTIQKNTSTSYGLTLVIGLPFPAEICDRIQHIQQQLEALLPGRFSWYGLEHLHATLVAPLRGRYREHPPLQREELPSDLQNFTCDLVNFFAECQPYSLELIGVYVTEEGFVMTGEDTLVQRLASSLLGYPELDQPKYLGGLHVAIGFFNTTRPFYTEKERARFEATLAQLRAVPVGRMTVQQVWLVHYANRTLSRIVGKVPLALGRASDLTVEGLLRGLNIAASYPTGRSAAR